MLDTLRRGIGGFLAKILLGILVLSFGIWGIADVFRGGGQPPLAKVGSVTLTEDDFKRGTMEEMGSLGRQFGGQQLTLDQARQLSKVLGRDFDAGVLAGLIRDAAIDQHAGDLGLGLGVTTAINRIKADPRFQAPTGGFSREALNLYLSQAGQSEGRYAQGRRDAMMRDHIYGALLHGVVTPRITVETLHRFREETRVIEYVALDPAKLPKAEAPAEAKIKEVFEKSKARFMTPELRKASILVVSVDTLKAKAGIADADIRKSFEETKESYETPEKRKVSQIGFKDKAAAEKALADIKGGKTFEQAAEAAGFKQTDWDLGAVTRKDMIDPKAAEVAFSLAKGAVSGVVDGGLTFAVLRVTDIEPGKTVTFDQVKEQVRDKLAVAKVAPLIQGLHDKVDDERGARRPLRQIAEKLGLAYEELAAVDKTGRGPDGKQAYKTPEAVHAMKMLFDTAVGLEREPIEIPNGGYIWGEVHAITPAKQRPLAEVSAEIARELTEAEQDRLVQEAAGKLFESVKAAKATLEDIAKQHGTKVQVTKAFKRSGAIEGVPATVVQGAFALPKGGGELVRTDDGRSRIIMRLKEVVSAPPPTQQQLEALAKEVSRHMQADLLNEYVVAARARLPITINEAVFKRLTGGGEQQ